MDIYRDLKNRLRVERLTRMLIGRKVSVTEGDLDAVIDEELAKPWEDVDGDLLKFCYEEMNMLKKKKVVEQLAKGGAPYKSIAFAYIIYTGDDDVTIKFFQHKTKKVIQRHLEHARRNAMQQILNKEISPDDETFPFTLVEFK